MTTDALAQLLRGLAVTLTKSLQDTIAKKDAQIGELQVRVVSLEERCDDLEQYSRRNTVRIRGLAESANEETDGLVKEFAAHKLDVKIGTSDLVRSHRVGRKTEDRSAPRDIIVRFTTHNTKARFILLTPTSRRQSAAQILTHTNIGPVHTPAFAADDLSLRSIRLDGVGIRRVQFS